MLILAGVAVNIALNGDNIFVKANKAREDWNAKVAEEDDEINSIFGEIQRTEKVKIKDAMKVGDFVQYEADESEYTIPAEIAGAEQTLRTDNTVKWRVWKIDEENVIIIPAQSVNPIKLYGVAGYQNGPEAINYACKELYKNTSLGVLENNIRIMNYSDIGEVAGFNKESTSYTINYRNNNYTYNYGQVVELTTGNYFYTYEENGVTVSSETAKSASESNPVNVKTNYIYKGTTLAGRALLEWQNINNDKFESITYGDLLNLSWLAESISFIANPQTVQYGVATVSGHDLYGCRLVTSSNGIVSQDDSKITRGILPMVYLSSELYLAPTNNGDGRTSETAWKIAK